MCENRSRERVRYFIAVKGKLKLSFPAAIEYNYNCPEQGCGGEEEAAMGKMSELAAELAELKRCGQAVRGGCV